MEWVKNTKDFLLLDGRQLATEIRAKPENTRKLWEKAYLWFHDNFEMIIIVGGFILLGLLIYNYLGDEGCHVGDSLSTVESKILGHSKSAPLISNQHPSRVYNNLRLDGSSIRKSQKQKGGADVNNSSSSTNTPTPTAQTTLKTKNELRAEAIQSATAAADAATAAKEAKKNKPGETGTDDKNDTKTNKEPGFIKKKADENRLKVKTFVKNIKGNTLGKASAAWESVKSGEALELGKEKFADALYNSKDFVRQHAKAGYALAFTTFMVIGFGLFFVPTLIMFIIGGITLAIFNKQKMAFLANT